MSHVFKQAKTLPAKDVALFNNAFKYHERKQYKKALQAVNSILQNHKEHGESMAMKALIMSSMNRKEDAYDLIKRSLRTCITSAACWHVYGLIYRADHNYAEAIKCYRKARQYDSENLLILRDLSFLQVQIRDLTGFLQTRLEMLRNKPQRHEHWFAVSSAYFLLGNYEAAYEILEKFETAISKSNTVDEVLEKNERKLFMVNLLMRAKMYKEALERLDSSMSSITDLTTAKEYRFEILLNLERLAEAEEVARSLVDLNSENLNYHSMLHRTLKLCPDQNGIYTPEQVEKLESISAEIMKADPRCAAINTLRLRYLPAGPEFKKCLEESFRKAVLKGVPSHFSTIKPLYKDSKKAEIIAEIIESNYASYKENKTLPGSDKTVSATTFIWLSDFLAQHYDTIGKGEEALRAIEEAIQHTPTTVELYMCKAKILKHAHDLKGAAIELEKARRLDLADRYINTKASKYLFRANEVERGEQTVELFTKDAENKSISTLHEMQCIWYELESGAAYKRVGENGKALKQYNYIEKHFLDFLEDQFDFHAYCLRRRTMQAYTDMISASDKLYTRPEYFATASAIINIRLALYDAPKEVQKSEDELFAGLSGTELKKAKRKWRKQQLIQQEEEKQRKLEEEKQRKLENSQKKKSAEDDDPNGEKLLTLDHMEDATKFLRKLEEHQSTRFETSLLGFEVYLRKKRFLLALRSLKRLIAKEGLNHPKIHTNIIRFFHAFKDASVSPVITQLVDEEKAKILQGKTLEEFNHQFSSSHPDSYPHRVAYVRAALLLDPSKVETCKKDILNISISGATHQVLEETFELFRTQLSKEIMDEFAAVCRQAFPRSSFFSLSPREEFIAYLEKYEEDDDINAELLPKKNR